MATVSPFSCQFIHHKCQHEELFLPSYLRTNRTNHTKIMRCFPHCCPHHRNRSYCGSPISIQLEQVLQDSQHALSSGDVAVFARFRPLSATPLVVGERITVDTIQGALQRNDPSKGEWIESELSHGYTANGVASWIFEINASGRWYYPWSGAATIALRATEHTFEVLVFRRHSAQELELLAHTASPKFRLMSFRRGATTPTTIATGKDGELDVSSEGSPRTSPKILTTSKPKKATKKRVYSDASTVKRIGIPSEHKTAAALPMTSVSRAPSPANATLATAVLPSLHESAFAIHRGASPLSTLLQWLQELPLASSGSRRLREWEQVVLDTCVAHQAAARGGDVKRELVPILSALQVSSSPPYPSTASTLDVIDATVRLFIHLFLTVDGCRSTNLTVNTSQLLTPSADGSSSARGMAHYSWLNEIERRARLFTDTRTSASWANLMTTVSHLRQQRQARDIDESFGYQAFVAQWREQFVQQQKQAVKGSKRAKLNHQVSSKPHQFFKADPRVWVSRMEDVSIEMSETTNHALSLLTLMHFWQQLSCLRLDFTSCSSTQVPQLALASVFSTLVQDSCFTRLTLDGQYRWFSCLPSGAATTGTTLMGFILGDYIGHATSAGTIHFTTFLWPSPESSSGESCAYAWHWTSDMNSLSTSSTTMSVIVEMARVDPQTPLSFETMAITEKLRCIGRWQHVCQAQLKYHAQ